MGTDLTEQDAFLILNALPGLGSIALNRFLAAFGGDPREVLAADEVRLREVPDVSAKACAIVGGWEGQFDPAAERARMAAAGVEFISLRDPAYPERLREIPDPPAGLYRLGRQVFDRPAVAIVGTRRCTLYGAGVARKLGSELARAGFCIVSGLARGIDTAAHEGALAADGATAAVLGTGIDRIYPPENLELYRRIAETGAVFSEFPFGRSATKQAFPMRNRVVAGMCAAVVVVESEATGGALITARFGGEQGRLVFAVPGRIDQSTSAGCHQLIRDGATLLTHVDDLFQELTYLDGFRPSAIAAPPGGSPADRPDLTKNEKRVAACFRGGEILTPDALTLQSGLSAPQISAALMMLELKHVVAKRADGSYEECH